MIDALRRNPLIAALALACVVLAGVLVFELAMMGGAHVSSPARKAVPAESKLLPPLVALSPEQAYPETVSRPLWIPTRRPAPAAAVAPASFARGQFILQGVIVAGGTQIAMLREKASGRMHRVEKGREVNGLRVADVDPEKVTLAQGDEREVLELRVQRPGAPGTPGGPAVPPPAAAALAGPFATAPSPAQPQASGATPPVPPPSAPPAGSPFGAPPRPPGTTSPGPLAPTAPGTPPAVANPSATPVPQQATSAPMTPEELLARRRARRNQSP